jgi:hypothetical protein
VKRIATSVSGDIALKVLQSFSIVSSDLQGRTAQLIPRLDYNLSFTDQWRNPDDIMALFSDDVDVQAGKSYCKAMEVTIPIDDWRDFKHFSAELSPGGKGIIIRKPIMAQYRLNRKEIEESYENDADESARDSFQKVHESHANEMTKGGDTPLKELYLKFPDDILGTAQFFHGGAPPTSLKLKKDIRNVSYQRSNGETHQRLVAFWRVHVANSTKVRRLSDQSLGEDLDQLLKKRMNISNP